jgi:hypothetical protein
MLLFLLGVLRTSRQPHDSIIECTGVPPKTFEPNISVICQRIKKCNFNTCFQWIKSLA